MIQTFLIILINVTAALFVAWIYLLPSKIALNKAYGKTGPLMLVNLVFGFTVIGWLVTLIWSLAAPRSV